MPTKRELRLQRKVSRLHRKHRTLLPFWMQIRYRERYFYVGVVEIDEADLDLASTLDAVQLNPKRYVMIVEGWGLTKWGARRRLAQRKTLLKSRIDAEREDLRWRYAN